MSVNTAELVTKFNQIQEDIKPRLGKYGTVSGYISVTRLIKEISDDSFLKEWVARVGQAEADKITTAAATRGSRMHDLIEQRWNNEPLELDLTRPGDLHYNKLCHLLDNIEPLFVESCLYSDKLELTGKTDTIGFYKGVLSTIDYKTSRKPKQPQWMRAYGVQVALYTMMFYDMTGIAIKQGVLLNAPDDEDDGLLYNPAQEIIFPISQYVGDAINVLRRHKQGDRNCIKL